MDGLLSKSLLSKGVLFGAIADDSIPEYFYDHGVENVYWDTGYSTDGNAGGGEQGKESTDLYVYAYNNSDGGAWRTWVTGFSYDMTDINTINFLIDFSYTRTSTGDAGYYLSIGSSSSAACYTDSVKVSALNTSRSQTIVSLDVSALTGKYFIKVASMAAIATTATLKVYEVWRS